MIEPWALALIAGVVGLSLGSFLNVCVLRWPVGDSVVSPPSRCPGCREPIPWYDNIPLLSYFLLLGRCRCCRARISVQYPLVELTTALIWAGVFLGLGMGGEALRGSVFLTILLGIAISDARYYVIPNQLSLGGGVLGLLLAFLPGGVSIVEALLGAMTGYALLWGVAALGTWIFKKEAMGGGDLKMIGMVGAYLGVPGVLLTVFLGALLGAVIFGPISWRTGKLVPFGIFLAAGGALAYGWGEAMVEWYTTSILGM